jgi:superfamily II DNA or RNA helicase
MKFVVPIRRLGVSEELVKATATGFSRGPSAGHKYIKREFVGFRNGRIVYRYYYADDKVREAGKKQVEGTEAIETHHEHELTSNIHKLFKNLAKNRVKPSEVTEDSLVRALGIEGVKVHLHPEFLRRFHASFAAKEKAQPDEEIERFPLARVYRAFQMLPEPMRALIGDDQLKKIIITTRNDPDEVALWAEHGTVPPAGWSNGQTGEVHLLADGTPGTHGSPPGFTAEPVGRPRFGSRFTIAEEIVWHELAHQMHDALISSKSAIWEEWKELSLRDPQRISDYAFTNEKEDWAESVACMISRPKQMARQCPARYEFFRKHGLIPGPSLDKMLKVPDEELRWWDLKPASKAARRIAAQREIEGQPSYVGAYRSEKDQFYTVHYKGRAVFFRLGPPDKDAELSGWEPVPPTIDPETELPVYDSPTAARFQSQQVYKEIYDENGNALTPHQALLYLRQDDEDFNEKIGDDVVGWEPGELQSHLGRIIFAKLGESRASQEKERERVRKLREKGKTSAELREDRHEWVPLEMSREEFEALTPTFKFEGLRKAEKQPLLKRVYDKKLKRPVVVTAHDPITGKVEPVRAATVYEMPNPDGTKTKITVNESEPFVPGGRFVLPLSVTRRESSGVDVTEQRWIRYRIQPDGRLTPEEKPFAWKRTKSGKLRKVATGTWPELRWDRLEPAKLARDLGTTAEMLLHKNGKIEAGQITDPLLAKLINPLGERIRNEGDLVRLMRDAAKAQASTWVTVQTGTDKNPSYAHIKITFDGGGNPLLAGEYWNRILGVEQARVDSLLDSKNKINVEGVREIPPRTIEFGQGALIKYRDPTSERIVYGEIVEVQDAFDENDEKIPGKSTFKVQPLKGQGTGLAKIARISEKDAEKVTTAVDRNDVTRQRRDVMPMKNHLLLYGDNLRFDADGKLRGGTVRLKLPSDGSISIEEIRRFPAVRSDDTGPFIDLRDISVLREEFGGFVMDSYVQQLLDDLMRSEKRNVERAKQRDVVLPSQITSPDGGVNTDEENGGLLKGLKPTLANGSRFKLGSHQEEFLRLCARAEGRCMAAHFMGTGKTIAALAAIRLMKNAKKPDGTPIEGSPRKRVAIVVPLNTAVQWQRAAIDFTEKGATLIGANTLAGAVQAFSPKNWPPKKDGESEEAYARRVAEARAEWLKKNPSGWDPEADKENDVVIIPFEYFRDNEADLRMHGGFDGIIVDEAHAIARENELSRAVERWNPSMNLFLLLTGTPITNRLNTIPRYFDLLTNGKSPFGTEKQFSQRYLAPSAVMVANGSKNPPRTDLNPQRASELASYLATRMHVALTEDVKGKTMPAVLLDENQPAHMTGMQEKVYRLAMAAMTEQEMIKLEEAGALGTDEAAAFSGGMRRKVNVARAFANSPGYKPPDQREFVTYIEKIAEKKGKTGKTEIKEVERVFMLPDFKRCTGKPPHGFGGKWPSAKDVEKGRISEGEFEVLSFYVTQILGIDYYKLAGTEIDKALLADIKKGFVNGTSWGKIPNPDYGPEGGIARGYLDADGNLKPLVAEWNGERIEVPIGTKFIRDPSKKAAGLYYHQDDWDFNGTFTDDAEGGDDEEDDESVEEAEGDKKKKAGLQQQKAKDPKLSIQLSPLRRRERAMFDVAMTANNAKADELERYIRERTNTATGGNPDAQFILFGNRIGSSCRTMESKLRSMGYMDVNEALGHEDTGYSSDEDKKRRPKMGYFVTYFGKGATLGDRDVNSEIFRKVKDDMGKDTETSMFVHRTLTGSVGKPPKIGEFFEGWSRAERQRISRLFAGPDGTGGIEVPMRVTTRVVGDETRLGYVYESEISAKDRKLIQELEQRRNAAPLEKKDVFTKQLNAIFQKYVTDRAPLSTHQIDVFNNCKMMIASDAAQVGLNWGNASELVMYDSLHSPMQEWQRITRAARMLDAIIPDKAKPVFDRLGEIVREIEAKNGLAEYSGMESAMSIIHEAWEALDEAEKSQAMSMGFNPVVAAEAFFAHRAFSKIAEMRPKVRDQLRQYGRKLEPVERVDPVTGAVRVIERQIKPAEITNADIMNEILEKHLSPFEREILKSRKYLVNVKRLTTSVNMPVFRTVQITDPNTGEKKKIRVPTGDVVPEVPSKAELSQLTQGRAKQVPFEFFMKTVQDGVPVETQYDFLPTTGHSLAAMSQLPSAPPRERKPAAEAPQPPAVPTAKSEIVEAVPLSKRQQKQAEMLARWKAKREKLAAKMAAMKVKFEAQKAKRDAKKRKEAAKKAAATRAAKKAAMTQKSFSRFFIPFSKFKGDA